MRIQERAKVDVRLGFGPLGDEGCSVSNIRSTGADGATQVEIEIVAGPETWAKMIGSLIAQCDADRRIAFLRTLGAEAGPDVDDMLRDALAAAGS